MRLMRARSTCPSQVYGYSSTSTTLQSRFIITITVSILLIEWHDMESEEGEGGKHSPCLHVSALVFVVFLPNRRNHGLLRWRIESFPLNLTETYYNTVRDVLELLLLAPPPQTLREVNSIISLVWEGRGCLYVRWVCRAAVSSEVSIGLAYCGHVVCKWGTVEWWCTQRHK